MQRVSISQLSTSRWSFHKDILKYASLQCNAVGIWRTKVDEIGAQEAADSLFEMKMSVSSLNWCGGFTGSTGMTYVDAVNDAIDSVKLAGMLGAETLILHPGARNGHTHRHANRLLETALNSIVPVAADYGVRIALEPMQFAAKCPWTYLKGHQEVLQLINNYDPVDVGVVLDLFHVGTCYELLTMLPAIRDRVVLVQMADRIRAGNFDGNRCRLGQGVLPIQDWLRKLAEIDYRGFYEIETWGVAKNPSQYTEIIASDFNFAKEQLGLATQNATNPSQSTR